MRPKDRAVVLVFLLLTGMGFRVFPQQFIITDAAGGIFSSDQKLSFSLTAPGWFRILLDSREIYRGKGPAFPELGVPWGEERGFTLGAEFYSPDNVLKENRSWYIFIDKKPPSPPLLEFRKTPQGLRLVQLGPRQDAKIRAWADMSGSLVFFPDLAENFSVAKSSGAGFVGDNFAGEVPPADSFSAVVWAEDAAGNCSIPQGEFFEIPPVKIENPVPGNWLNPQILIISGTEGKSVYWTVDGTNPLEPGGAGRLYRGPERIAKDGQITLRIAWHDAAGKIREDRVVYKVSGAPAAASSLDAFRRAEERELQSPVILSVPPAFFWSMGGIPRQAGGGAVNLRPQPLVKRVTALHLSAGEAGGIFRFAYLLNGGGNGGTRKSPGSSRSTISSGESFLSTGMGTVPLRIISSGNSRVILWPPAQGIIYFSWLDRGPWQEGKGPLPVPLEGGMLRWFVQGREGETAGNGGSSFFGPYSVVIPSLSGGGDQLRGRIACRNYSENSGWNFVSDLLDYTPGIVTNRISAGVTSGTTVPDVCDGEDLEWAFISSAGQIMEAGRRDRLAPRAPELAAPLEGGWTRGPVKVSIFSDEKDAAGFISARITYASGTVQNVNGIGSVDIASTLGELANVTVEGVLEDPSGNLSPKTVRNFVLDPATIYVSSEALTVGTASGPDSGGGMDNPFTSLKEAVDYAVKQGLHDIRIAGTLELEEPLSIPVDIRIDGSWGQQERGTAKSGVKAALIMRDSFCWNLVPGVSLVLSGVSMERRNGNVPLIQAGKNARLGIENSAFTITGPFLAMENGVCDIRDSRISMNISGERRIPALSARDSVIRINNSHLELEGDYGLLADIAGGSFSSGDSSFFTAGTQTASVFNINNARGIFSNLTLKAKARDFASIMDVSGSGLVLSGGTLGVSARDANALLFDRCTAVLFNSEIRLEGALTERAAEIRGAFPLVQDCRFYSIGTAKRSDVFFGTEADSPGAGTVTGNGFSGFTNIWGRSWSLEKLPDFNRAFASTDKPNSAREDPPAGNSL